MYEILKDIFSGWHDSDPEARKRIKGKIHDKYSRELSIMFSDIADFSYKTRAIGTVEFLSQLDLVYSIARKHTRKNKGRIIRTIGDNLFFAFDGPLESLKTAVSIQKELARENEGKDDPLQKIQVCFGITYGQCLDFKREIYGDCVNMASKLAEDIADSNDILLGEKAFSMIKGHLQDIPAVMENTVISDIPLCYYRLVSLPDML